MSEENHRGQCHAMDLNLFMAIQGYQRVYELHLKHPLLSQILARTEFDGPIGEFISRYNAGEFGPCWYKVMSRDPRG